MKDFVYTRDGDEDSDVKGLLAFAEAMLGRPLYLWQRYMLMSMLDGRIMYVPGRSIGKNETLNIFKEWKERPHKTPDAIYTYDMLMEGANINT